MGKYPVPGQEMPFRPEAGVAGVINLIGRRRPVADIYRFA
jgi:hypothetical protein